MFYYQLLMMQWRHNFWRKKFIRAESRIRDISWSIKNQYFFIIDTFTIWKLCSYKYCCEQKLVQVMGNNFRILNAQVVYDLICKIGYNQCNVYQSLIFMWPYHLCMYMYIWMSFIVFTSWELITNRDKGKS